MSQARRAMPPDAPAGGSFASMALLRPRSGSLPASIVAQRRVPPRRSRPRIAVGIVDLYAGQFLPSRGGDDEEHIDAVPWVLTAVGQPHLELRHRHQPVRDRPAGQVGSS